MNHVTRFFSGTLVAGMMVAGIATLTASTVSAKPVLACSNGTCCTFDDTTGQIYDCRPA
jgi:hypothetical protein